MKAIEYVWLNNGNKMPVLGFGTLQIEDGTLCEDYIYEAIKAGYRMFDTAAAYFNEESIGRAVKKAIHEQIVRREELFLITKLWIQDAGQDKTREAVLKSMERLQVDYLDLYLIHQPFGDYYGAWRVMEQLVEEGLLRNIGVCNFSKEKLMDLSLNCKILPTVNQIEIHPFFLHEEELSVMKDLHIAPMAWGPLSEGQRDIFHTPILETIGKKYGKSSAQVILRWHIQKGIAAIPKTTLKNHLYENMDIWNFKLTESDMRDIETLNIGHSEIIDHNSAYTAKWLNQWKIHE